MARQSQPVQRSEQDRLPARRAVDMSLSDRERAEGFLLSEAKQGSGERASPGVLPNEVRQGSSERVSDGVLRYVVPAYTIHPID